MDMFRTSEVRHPLLPLQLLAVTLIQMQIA